MADAQQVSPPDDSDAATTDPTGVTGGTSLEDERGVDLADLRARLRLSPAERVQRLLDEVLVWTEIRWAAETARKQ